MRHERSLDALNFFLADVRQGLGPYLAIYLLTERHWAEDRIGFVMTIATVCGLIVQTPAGALTDASHAKRAIIAAAALVVVYGVGGAVEDYLRGQGVAPFFTMGDAYGEVYERMLAVLARLDPGELDFRPERRAAISEMAAGSLGSAFLDVDATVDAYCAQHNSEKPTDVDKLVELHIKAVLEWLQTLTILDHDGNAIINRPEAGERSGLVEPETEARHQQSALS